MLTANAPAAYILSHCMSNKLLVNHIQLDCWCFWSSTLISFDQISALVSSSALRPRQLQVFSQAEDELIQLFLSHIARFSLTLHNDHVLCLVDVDCLQQTNQTGSSLVDCSAAAQNPA